jgi:hypothetical protein
MLSLKLLFLIGVSGVGMIHGVHLFGLWLVPRELLSSVCYSVRLVLILFSDREIGCMCSFHMLR